MRQKVKITDDTGALNFLYKTPIGRGFLKPLTSRPLSKCAGKLMDSKLSKAYINSFVRKNNIDLSEYENVSYKSFNDFFTRHIKPENRTISETGFISPCDSLLSVYNISDTSRFAIKGRTYSVLELTQDVNLVKRYSGGICMVFRLTVTDYHRYCYIDNGTKGDNYFIKGILHTVQPVACGECDVYKENCREYTVMQTEHYGTVTQVEIGAMLVGRICNNDGSGEITRGKEKGRFEFGGSTIVLLLEKNAVKLDEEFFENTKNGYETKVKYGECIGK